MSPSRVSVCFNALALAAGLLQACAQSGAVTGGGGTGGTGTGGATSTETGGAIGTGGRGTGGTTTGATGGVVGTGGVGSGGATGSAGAASSTESGGTSGAAGRGTGGDAAGTAGHAATGGPAGTAGRGSGAGSGGQSASGGQPGSGGATECPGASYDAASPPATLTLSGNLGAHDPAAYVSGNTIYLAATGLIGKVSTNLTAWTATANPLPIPAWAAAATGANGLWAPDISSFGGVYHLFYAASSFGSNKSCIGQATRAALDSGSWADQGKVICSNMGENDNWNAIDPNVVIDDAGTPWLAFGSFWSGIKMVKLTAAGTRADTMLYSLANGANSRGSLEGAWVFKRCGTYYLFTSWGSCCTSPFDYNIRVGRSNVVTGPYVDKAGTPLMSGGGTLLVKGDSNWTAPGHNAVITYNNRTYNLYHALRGGSGGPATLRISEIAWDADGWPVSGGP